MNCKKELERHAKFPIRDMYFVQKCTTSTNFEYRMFSSKNE